MKIAHSSTMVDTKPWEHLLDNEQTVQSTEAVTGVSWYTSRGQVRGR